jgi:hypothetical protein
MQRNTFFKIKQLQKVLIVALCLGGTMAVQALPVTGTPDRECAMVLHKALALLNQVYENDEGYVKWSVQNGMAGDKGPALEEELAWQGLKTLYKNQHMFLYRDGKEEVLIMDDQELILIRRQAVIGKEDLMPAASQADTLLSNASSVSCASSEGKNSTILNYPRVVKGQFNPVKSMEIYCNKQGRLQIMNLLLRQDDKILTQRVEMLKMSKSVGAELLTHKARAFVFDSKKNLLPQYKDYQIIDWKQ